jgi:hypothetical protein
MRLLIASKRSALGRAPGVVVYVISHSVQMALARKIITVKCI